jgi:hypothetical protein
LVSFWFCFQKKFGPGLPDVSSHIIPSGNTFVYSEALSKIYPNTDFCFENFPSGNPGLVFRFPNTQATKNVKHPTTCSPGAIRTHVPPIQRQRLRPGVDVMILSFCDFRQFFGEKLAFN